MVKESDFGRPGQKIDWGHFVSQKLHRNRLSVLPPHPLAWGRRRIFQSTQLGNFAASCVSDLCDPSASRQPIS